MKNRDVVSEAALRSGASELVCAQVIENYEVYGEHNVSRMSKKYINEISDFISDKMVIDKAECTKIMNHVFDVTSEQIRTKIPFMKQKKTTNTEEM